MGGLGAPGMPGAPPGRGGGGRGRRRAAGGAGGAGGGGAETLQIIVQTNYQVMAYTTSELHVAMLSVCATRR